ncbi:MAG: glutamine--fructose-6-phosphate transaminase (isomerizing), partial [Candidatus Spyradocola sp.]
MCGIVGYIGPERATDMLMEGLTRLEYRGYDSAGVAVYENGKIKVVKARGKLECLRHKLEGQPLYGHVGIGHTRWATHGEPSDENSHPHLSKSGRIAVVHNGIIENYAPLREKLIHKGYEFVSETDTEVFAHLLEDTFQRGNGDILHAVRETVLMLEGAYALGVLCSRFPDRIIAARKDSPLIIGLGDGCNYIASDIPAVLPYTRRVYLLEEGEMAQVFADHVEIYDMDLQRVDKEVYEVTWSVDAAERGGYAHFMLKEIYDQARAMRDTISPRVKDGRFDLTEAGLTDELLKDVRRVVITACGTASYAGQVGRSLIEKLCRVPVEIDVASEFRYRDPILSPEDLFIVVSQSGETADTLAALRLAKSRGCKVLAITNVVGSTIAREADNVLYTWAGPEIAVASTKAYTTQVLCFMMIALQMALVKGQLTQAQYDDYMKEFLTIPEKTEQILSDVTPIQKLAARFFSQEDMFFIGRGLDNALCMEASLKLKEISYIHSEAMAAGELKHGTIALIEPGRLVVAMCTQTATMDKLFSNIPEVLTRGAV